MKARSVKNPFAVRISAGVKTREIRTWSTPYRGDLLICASATPAQGGEGYTQGAAYCVAELHDITQELRGETRVFVWHLRNVRQVERFHVSGNVKLFEVPDHKIRYRREQRPFDAADMKDRIKRMRALVIAKLEPLPALFVVCFAVYCFKNCLAIQHLRGRVKAKKRCELLCSFARSKNKRC